MHDQFQPSQRLGFKSLRRRISYSLFTKDYSHSLPQSSSVTEDYSHSLPQSSSVRIVVIHCHSLLSKDYIVIRGHSLLSKDYIVIRGHTVSSVRIVVIHCHSLLSKDCSHSLPQSSSVSSLDSLRTMDSDAVLKPDRSDPLLATPKVKFDFYSDPSASIVSESFRPSPHPTPSPLPPPTPSEVIEEVLADHDQ